MQAAAECKQCVEVNHFEHLWFITLDGERTKICTRCWPLYKYECIPVGEKMQQIFASETHVVMVEPDDQPSKAMIVSSLDELPRLFLCPEFKNIRGAIKYRWARFSHEMLTPDGLFFHHSDPRYADYSDPMELFRLILDDGWGELSPEFTNPSALWKHILDHYKIDEHHSFWETIAKPTPELVFAQKCTTVTELTTPVVVQQTIEWEQLANQTFQGLDRERHAGLMQVVPTVFQYLGPEFYNGQPQQFHPDVDPITRARLTLKRYAQGWQEADRLQKRRRISPILPAADGRFARNP